MLTNRLSLPARAAVGARQGQVGVPVARRGTGAPRVRLQRSAVQVEAPAARNIQELVNRLQTLESQLASMFEPGKRMPKAAEVGRMRKDIDAVKAQLMMYLNTDVDVNGADNEAAQTARMLLDGALQATSDEFPRWDAPRNSPEYELQLAVLELENSRLREEARLLLERQALLEELADQKGVSIKGR